MIQSWALAVYFKLLYCGKYYFLCFQQCEFDLGEAHFIRPNSEIALLQDTIGGK